MEPSQQCVSQKTAERLKELGVPQKSYFYYILHREKWRLESGILFDTVDGEWGCGCCLLDLEHISAFTSGELGEMLPSNLEKKESENIFSLFRLRIEKFANSTWWVSYNHCDESLVKEFDDKNLPEAMGKMLIHLLENKLITL
jgi:hypothetical protein